MTVGIVAAWLLLVSDFFSLTGLGFGHSLWVQEQQEEGHGCVTKFIQPDLIYFSFLCERVSLFDETMVWSFFFFGLLIACTGELVFFLCYIKLPYCVFMNWSLQLRAHLREKAYAHCLIHISSVRGLYKHAVLLSVTGFVFVFFLIIVNFTFNLCVVRSSRLNTACKSLTKVCVFYQVSVWAVISGDVWKRN